MKRKSLTSGSAGPLPPGADLYAVLGVAHTATLSDLKKAYRVQARRHHPDRGGREEDFKHVRLAWWVLSDPQRRWHYDDTGEVDQDGPELHRSKLLNILSQVLTAVVQGMLKSDLDPAREDVVAHLKDCCTNTATELKQQQTAARKVAATLNKVCARVGVKAGEENSVAAILTAQAADLDRQIKDLGERARLHLEVRGLLKHYQYRCDAQEVQMYSVGTQYIKFTFKGFGGSTSTS